MNRIVSSKVVKLLKIRSKGANTLIIHQTKIEITAVDPEQYPANSMPDIAFAGRSNVGKSSIINALVNRKGLARVGATPGKTREINFYNINDALYLVDLPGYGYASVSKEKKATWYEIIETYLHRRLQLRIVILLVDIRHLPSDDDKIMYKWIVANELSHLVVATKADKIIRAQYKPKCQEIRTALGMAESIPLITFSAETKLGREEIWKEIERLLAGDGVSFL